MTERVTGAGNALQATARRLQERAAAQLRAAQQSLTFSENGSGRMTKVARTNTAQIRKLKAAGWVCLDEDLAPQVSQTTPLPVAEVIPEATIVDTPAAFEVAASAAPAAAPASNAGGPAAVPAPAAKPVDIFMQLDIDLTELEEDAAPLLDNRVDKLIARLRKVVSEHQEGKYIWPKFKKDPPSPVGF